MVGSFNDGDQTTTNLYIGNVNPAVNENDLCDVFVAFGPLASVKIMWPRTDEERARNRNSGFVAYMRRQDAENALSCLNGINIKGYDIKLGWAKQVAIPPMPIAFPDPIKIEHAQALMSRLTAGVPPLDSIPLPPMFGSQPNPQEDSSSQETNRKKGKLDEKDADHLEKSLDGLNTKRNSIADCMLFCINHSYAAKDVIERICQSILNDGQSDTVNTDDKLKKKLAKIFLISDILHNCSAQVTNASYYRGGFKAKLVTIFEHIANHLVMINDPNVIDNMKQRILTIFKAWKDWTLYEDDFIVNLSAVALGIKKEDHHDRRSQVISNKSICDKQEISDDLDGTPINREQLQRSLESKGLTLEWYKSLGLDTDDSPRCEDNNINVSYWKRPLVTGLDEVDSVNPDPKSKIRNDTKEWKAKRAAFKTTKWDTIDPDEVAEQVVTLSKWSNTFVTDSSMDDEKNDSKTNENHEETDICETKTFINTSPDTTTIPYESKRKEPEIDTNIGSSDSKSSINKKPKLDIEEGEIEGSDDE